MCCCIYVLTRSFTSHLDFSSLIMSSSRKASSSLKGQPSFGNPYELLGLEPGASDADIARAYRKLALKLHPDKQQNKKRTLTSDETEKLNKQFHDIKEARAFLLDPDNREWRLKYEAQLASERLRREENERRERGMSEHRKRLRDELRQREDDEREKAKRSLGISGDAAGATVGKRRRHDDYDSMEKLRKEGNRMREEYAQRAAKEAAKQEARDRKERKVQLEERQVRLKWSRGRIKVSPSEHSLAVLLSRFGEVESVEMIGSKGNSALITFVDASSCLPCVDAYTESDEMRANFVGKTQEVFRDDVPVEMEGSVKTTARDNENLVERKLRQAAERERLERLMEEDDDANLNQKSDKVHAPPKQPTNRASMLQFPLPFPDTPSFMDLLPWQKLERAEKVILGGILPLETLRRMQYSVGNS